MKKKFVATLVIAMAMGVLAGCGGPSDGPISPVSTLDPQPILTDAPQGSDSSEESSEQPSVEKEPVVYDDGMSSGGETHKIGDRVQVDGKLQSWLTGEWKDASVAERRSMAVMMPNNRRAGYKSTSPLLRQNGISYASVIYEAPVEGRITRLMALFEDYDDLTTIGPVRSSRDYYVYEAMAFDAIYVNWGLARPWVEELINSDRVDNISATVDGIYNGYDAAFKRDSSLNPGAVTEFTGYLDVAGYTKGVQARGYATDYDSSFGKIFEFADDGYLATYDDCADATKVYPGGTQTNSGGYGSHTPCFTYNAADRLYYRTQWGAAHTDGMNDQQLTVTNVIFKVCDGSERLPDDPNYDYLAFETIGSGNAYIFTNGKVVEATWSRSSESSPTHYFDRSGNEIVLNQGKTWICCIWDDYAQYMSWE